MTEMITFADPGYNFLPIWLGLGVLLLCIGLMIALYPVLGDAVAPIAIIPILVLVFAPVAAAMTYDSDCKVRNSEFFGANGLHGG